MFSLSQISSRVAVSLLFAVIARICDGDMVKHVRSAQCILVLSMAAVAVGRFNGVGSGECAVAVCVVGAELLLCVCVQVIRSGYVPQFHKAISQLQQLCTEGGRRGREGDGAGRGRLGSRVCPVRGARRVEERSGEGGASGSRRPVRVERVQSDIIQVSGRTRPSLLSSVQSTLQIHSPLQPSLQAPLSAGLLKGQLDGQQDVWVVFIQRAQRSPAAFASLWSFWNTKYRIKTRTDLTDLIIN